MASKPKEDDEALNGFFPMRFDVERSQRRVDHSEQQQTRKDAPQIAASAVHRDAADHASSDHFQLQPGSAGRLHLRRLHHDFPLTPLTAITPSHSVGWPENLFVV